jgi:transcriptional antiterminator RfaH
MDYWKQTSWFAVLCKPRQESLAATGVAKLGTEAFLPKVRCEQLVGGIPRMLSKPLFSGYFFARFCPILSLDIVRYAQGVLRVVGSSEGPIPLEDEIIACIQDRVEADGFIPLEQEPLVRGDRVEIRDGLFAGWMAEVEREWDDGKRVAILLNSITQARMLINKRCLEKVGSR